MGHLLGYARVSVSTTDQQPQLQVDALERAGCYVDAVTGLAERGIGFRSLQEAIDTTTRPPAASSSSTCSPPG
jgi:DNA invertase Pin-like site-specific DNA recombinase